MTEDQRADTATTTTATSTRPPRKRTHPVLLVLLGFVLAAVLAYALYFFQVQRPTQANREMNTQTIQQTVGLAGAQPLTLDRRFADADGDMVADPPDDQELIVDPPKLTFSYVATSQPELYQERFKEFVAYLTQALGRPVEYVPFRSPEDELRALKEGTLHIAGINTGSIPTAVNQCGFVPICGLAGAEGASSYRMQIIVPADSWIKAIHDLRGREITLTEPGSNSGFKAPLVLLSKDHGLQPGRDFTIRYSGGHDQSIAGIASETYQAAAVASDILTRAMSEDPPRIRKEQFRVIYESEPFPTAGFGYAWNLKPDLAAKIKEAFFKFEWKGTGVEKQFAASKQTKFVPVKFKDDFALVRRIDDAIRSVNTGAGEESAEPTTDESTTAPATTQAEEDGESFRRDTATGEAVKN
jgi:phosphonate transport system substrate-binding protein